MSIPLTVNGSTFQFPQTGNKQWGAAVTAWASAVTTGMLQKAGGAFTLTAEVDFGANYGLKSIYYKSRSSNPSQSGFIRGSNTDLITWRNGAGSGDNTLGVSPSNVLLYNGNPIGGTIAVENSPTINLDFTDETLTAEIVDNSITNVLINESAAIAVSKLAGGTSAQILFTNGSTPTWTTLAGDGYVSASGNLTVDGLRGKNLATSLANIGASQDGYALTWSQSGNEWTAAPGGGGGGEVELDNDVTGPSNANTVEQITGRPDGYVLVKCDSIIFDGYAINPTITQNNLSGGGGGGGGGEGLVIENGVLKIAGGDDVVIHALEFIYNADEFNYGNAELCQLAIDLGFNAISPLVGDTYGTMEYMQPLGDAALAAGLIIGFNGDATSDGRAWLTNPEFIEYTNSLPNCFMRLEIEVNLPPIYGDFPPLSAYVDGCLGLVNAYRAAGGTRVIQVGSYQGGRRLEYPRDAGTTVCAGDPLGQTMLGWQAYWNNAGTFYQGCADLPNGIAGTLQGVQQYNDIPNCAKCMGILWVNTEGFDTDVEDIITLALSNNQSFMWWDLWRDTEGAPPHLNRLVTEIWDPPVTWTATADIIVPMLLPSQTLYFEGWEGGGGGGGGGGGPTGLATGNTMTIKAQDGYTTGGTIAIRSGIGGSVNGPCQLYTGHDLAASFSQDTVIMNIGGAPLFWATDDIIKHYYGQAFNTRLVNDDITAQPDDTIMGIFELTDNITITLPTANLQVGLIYFIKDMDGSLGTYTVTIDADGGTINGSSTLVMNTADSSIILALIDNGQWFTLGGGAGGGGVPAVSNEDHIFLTAGDAVGFRKNIAKHYFYEDFDFIEDKAPDFNPIAFGTTNWLSGYRNVAGFISAVAALKNHPGIIRITTDNTNDSGTFIQRGFESEGGTFFPYFVEDIYRMEGCFRLTSESNCGFFFGLSDSDILEVPYASNRVAFLFDTDIDTNIQCVCRSDGYQTLVDSGVAPEEGTWKTYKILQDVDGTFTFYINEVLVATINTNVPSTEALALYVNMTTRTATEKSIDVDYVALDTIDLGGRYDAPAGEIEFISTDSGTTFPMNFEITSGENRLLVVTCTRTFGGGDGSTATFDGEAMDIASNTNEYVQVFYMFDPPVGFSNFNCSLASGTIVMCQYNGVGSFQEASQGSVQSFNYTVGSSALLVCVVGGDGTATPLAGNTDRYLSGGRAYVDRIEPAGGTFAVGTSGATFPDAAGAAFLGV